MIVSTEWLAAHLADPNLTIVDVRNVTNEPEAGWQMYLNGHLPGAVFLDMDTDLADRSDLSKGRHPLPDPKKFVKTLARVGIGKGTRVIAYDHTAGSNASRLWWMMRWIGAAEAAILDGGITKWAAEGRKRETGERQVLPALEPFEAITNDEMLVDKRTVARAKELGLLLLDARSPERFRGEREPIDTKAGHIAGAINAPWEQNVTSSADPVMRTPSELKSQYRALGVTDPDKTVCYCGSGVTACLDILALEMAEMRGAKLYPGSWSEWIADP
jgi:thiosulfate/3-mercaptopyruvate sulfurtransferase